MGKESIIVGAGKGNLLFFYPAGVTSQGINIWGVPTHFGGCPSWTNLLWGGGILWPCPTGGMESKSDRLEQEEKVNIGGESLKKVWWIFGWMLMADEVRRSGLRAFLPRGYILVGMENTAGSLRDVLSTQQVAGHVLQRFQTFPCSPTWSWLILPMCSLGSLPKSQIPLAKRFWKSFPNCRFFEKVTILEFSFFEEIKRISN